MHWVYIHTNRINGKSYVGQTRQKPEWRWMDGRGYAGQKKFWRAIQKYGWENFDHKVWEVDSKPEADYLEKYLIAFYNTVKTGYNITSGGSKDYHWKHDDEAKGKISEALKGRPKSAEHRKHLSEVNLGKHLSEETREKIRQRELGRKVTWGEKISATRLSKGIKHSEETKEKLRGIPKKKYKFTNPETGEVRIMTKGNGGCHLKGWIRGEEVCQS